MRLIHDDCLNAMKSMPDKSVDLILCDLPYGTTACKWDSIIPFVPLWDHYKRLIKSNHPIVLFGTQPFTSVLITSNLPMFKYSWVWEKHRPGGFVAAKLKPLKAHEDICVFTDGPIANRALPTSPYFPQGLVRIDKPWKRPKKYDGADVGTRYRRPSQALERVLEFSNYPKDVIKFNNPNSGLLHPTQKPIDLMEYLVRTYSAEGDLVLDNCMGSGTTGLACKNTNRDFIGIEKYEEYYEIAKLRINSEDGTKITDAKTGTVLLDGAVYDYGENS